jgi:hypothetical protein
LAAGLRGPLLAAASFCFGVPFSVVGSRSMNTLPFGSLPAAHLTQALLILAIALIPTSRLKNTATPFSQTGPWT